MPKRHRQPEPIDILAAGDKGNGKGNAPAAAASSSSGRQRSHSDDGGSDGAQDGASMMPTATAMSTASAASAQKKKKSSSSNINTAAAASETIVDYGDVASSAEGSSIRSDPSSGEVGFDSSELGDDGNQSDDSVADILAEDTDSDGDYEAFLGRGKARKGPGAGQKGDSSSSGSSEAYSDSDDDDSDDLDEEDEEGLFDSDDEEDDEGEEGEEGELDSADDGDGDDDDDDDDDDGSSANNQITVDFGVYDMREGHVDAVMHLMDQLCPDKMLEVDRDDLGAALTENPYTCIVKVDDDGDDDDDDDEEGGEGDAAAELYGLASVLDVAHGVQSHPAAFKPLVKLLREDVWRRVSGGIPPVDILLSTAADDAEEGEEEDEASSSPSPPTGPARKKARAEAAVSAAAKSVLLVSEYIRNVPIELTVQIFDDIVERVESDAQQRRQRGGDDDGDDSGAAAPVHVVPGCMFVVLAKVQRMVDPPVTLESKKKRREEEGEGKKKTTTATAASSSSATAAAAELLDLSAYAFWREEDNVLFDFRDQRVATLAYKCRPQFDGQAEQDVPLSLLFVLQYGAMRQAIAEMKKRATIKADITRF